MSIENRVLKYNQSGAFLLKKAEKLANNNKLIEALPFYRRAEAAEPDNLDYKLYLAEAYTDMGRFEDSNAILINMLKNKSTAITECFFGMGCNFMGLNDFERAIDSFEKYLECEPDGDYASEAAELLDILETTWELDELKLLVDANLSVANQAADEGKNLLDKGKFSAAITQFNKALELDANLVYAKNNLALALYCSGELDEAVKITEEILKKEKGNIHANCNMAIFLKEKDDIKGSDEHIGRVMKVAEEDVDFLQKVAYTLCELEKHEEARAKLKILLHSNPYDTKALFCMAIACVNLKNLPLANKYFSDIVKINPYDTKAQYYKMLINQSGFDSPLSYVYEVPPVEMLARLKWLESSVNRLDERVISLWQQNEYFVSVCVWGLWHDESGIAFCALKIIGHAGDSRAIEIMTATLLKKDVSDELKNAIFFELSRLDVPEPYIAYVGGEVVEVRTGASTLSHAPESYTNVDSLLCELFEGSAKELKSAQDIWYKYIKSLEDRYPKITKPHLWAAAVAYLTIGEPSFELTDITKHDLSVRGILLTAKKIQLRLGETKDDNA